MSRCLKRCFKVNVTSRDMNRYFFIMPDRLDKLASPFLVGFLCFRVYVYLAM